jgi:hypothetical protein
MTDYVLLRPAIQTGDVILWKGNSFAQRLIRIYGGYSHASLVVRFDRRTGGLEEHVFVVEAVGGGLKLDLLSESLKRAHGRAYHLRVPLSDEQRTQAKDIALRWAEKSTPYDFGGVFRNVLARVSVDVGRLYCSEWCWWVLEQVNFVTGKIAPRPGDLAKWLGIDPVEIEF